MPAGSARVRSVAPDCEAGRARLAAAARFAESAQVHGLHAEAGYVLFYDAARNALSAVLAVAGRRVSDGRGAHAVTISEAGRILGPSHRAAIITIDGARIARNRTEYDAQPISRQQLDAIQHASQAMLDVARAYVDLQCASPLVDGT